MSEAEDMRSIFITLSKGMKHRPDHDTIVARICNGDIKCDAINFDGEFCNVHVMTPDNDWDEWVYLTIRDGNVESDWSDMYMDDIKNNNNVFDMVMATAYNYAVEKGIIADDGDKYYFAV